MALGTLTAREAYLRRLGLSAEPPSVDELFRIHRAQVERVPYETLWIHMGERWSIEVSESFDRVAHRSRGGYCFHLNGALSELLRSLGYQVTRHVGGVHGPEGPNEAAMTNHLVLTVSGLPTEQNPSGNWYVDAGLGDALHEPLPLVAGTYQQGPFRLILEETPGDVGDWHLTHDPAGGFVGMSWRSAAAEPSMFHEHHQWLSTSPESGFVQVLTVQRRCATGLEVLRGLTFKRPGDDAVATLHSRDELVDVLRSAFGIDIGTVDREQLDALWSRLHRAHVEWEASGRS